MTGPSVLALLDPFVKGWPEHDIPEGEDPPCGVFPLADVLRGRYDTDVHFTAYACDVERRHSHGSIATPERSEAAGIRMVAAVFDVDGEGHQATEEWWQAERPKIEATVECGGFAYRTRGGYRLVFALSEVFKIRTAEDGERWSLAYLSSCDLLASVYGIKADRRCKEWQRLYRAPHATRDGVLLDLETIGDPDDLGSWYLGDPSGWAISEPHQEKPKNTESPDSRVIASSASRPRTAAVAMLGAAWPSEGRHGAQLALAGALCRDRWPEADAVDFLCGVCRTAGNEDRPKREKTVRDTYKAHAQGRHIQGWTALEAHVGAPVVAGARATLDPNADGIQALAELVGAKQAKGQTQETAPSPNAPKRRSRPAERARKLGGQDSVKLATGLHSVDVAIRGGFLLRKLAVIGGAPGAGKTALMCKLAYTWLTQGFHVAILASDEDADALLIRLGQLHGLSREALEGGDPAARDALAVWCDSVPLILADGDDEDATIEVVSRELRDAAGGAPSVLFVDSMQTARTGTELPKGADIRTRVNEAVRVLKRTAKVDGHLVFASSELAKAAYRNKAQADNVNALSAFKESGDIEYGVSFAMVLVSSPGTSDLVNGEIVKNRLGAGKPAFVLKLDHIKANVTETAREEQELRDPLTFVKDEVVAAVGEHGALTPNRIYSIIGGRKSVVLGAIKALLDDRKIIQATEGIRFPLPGEGGYGE